MARIKGSALLNRMAYLDEKGAPGQREQVVAKLSPEFQNAVEKGLLAVGWYPIDYMTELVRAMDQVMGKGDMGLYEDIGYHSAVKAIHGIYKLFFKLGSPEFIIGKAPTFWKQLMDSGNLYVTQVGKNDVLMGFTDFGVRPSLEVFLGLKGWTKALVEKSGGKNVKVEITKKPADGFHGGELSVKWQ